MSPLDLKRAKIAVSKLSHLGSARIIRGDFVEVPAALLRGGKVKRLYETHGGSHSSRAMARELSLARNMVLKHLISPDAMRPKPRRPRGSMLGPYAQHIDRQWAES